MTVFNLSLTPGSKQNIHRNATTSCVPRTVCELVSNPYHAITQTFLRQISCTTLILTLSGELERQLLMDALLFVYTLLR